MTPMAESPAATPAADSRVRKSSIESAVNALLKHKATQSSTQKLQLLPGDDYIYLNLSLKKIPSQPRTNPYRIPLPHPILDASSQLCLIVDDRPKSTTPPSDEIKKLIKSQDIPISKVIKISKLKTNYKPFEAKRKLCDSYDLFLVDKRVVHLLPKLIGKQFFKKKKLPLGVDLTKKNLKLKVEMTLGSALMYVRSGTCCVMKVGKVEMEKDEVVENVFDAIKGAVERVPKKWDGVRSLHLKFSDSVALPIYQAMPDLKLKIEGLKDREEEGDEGMKMSDNDGDVKEVSGVKDAKSGKKKKGRIHEVNYMDIGEDIVSDDDGIENVEETLMDEEKKTEKEEFDADETVGKKRKASKKGNAEKNVGKKPKKIESSDNDDIKNVEEKLMDEGKKKKNVGKKPKKIESDGNDDVEIVQEKMMDEGKKKTLGKKRSPLKKGKAEKIVGEKPKKKESSRKEEVAELVSKRSERIAKKTEEIAELVSKRSERIAKKRVSAK